MRSPIAGNWVIVLGRGGSAASCEDRAKVGVGEARERVKSQAKRLSERGQAPSRERDEARPQQARLGWHAVPTLPEAGRQLGQHAVRSLPWRLEAKGDREGCVPHPAGGARERGKRKRLSERGQAPSRERDEARPQQARLGWHAVPTLPEAARAEGPHVVRSLPKTEGRHVVPSLPQFFHSHSRAAGSVAATALPSTWPAFLQKTYW
jgi:hypothetical protein